MIDFMEQYFDVVLLNGSEKLSDCKHAFVAEYKYGKLKDSGNYGFVFCVDVGGDKMGCIIPTDKNIAFTDDFKDYLAYAVKKIHESLLYTFYAKSDRKHLVGIK